MWLEDKEIQACIDAGTPKQALKAFRALRPRYEAGDKVDIAPLTSDFIGLFAKNLNVIEMDHCLEFIIGVDGIPALPEPDNWIEAIKTACHCFDSVGVSLLADIVHIDQKGGSLAEMVMSSLEHCLINLPEERIFFAGHLVDCLLDGEEAIRQAVFVGLDRWQKTTKTYLVAKEVMTRLDPFRQSQWQNANPFNTGLTH